MPVFDAAQRGRRDARSNGKLPLRNAGATAGILQHVRADIAAGEAPPEATAAFVVGGVESCLAEALSAGDPGRLWDALPELMHFAAGSYLGKEEAEGAFERATVMLERERARLMGGKEEGAADEKGGKRWPSCA